MYSAALLSSHPPSGRVRIETEVGGGSEFAHILSHPPFGAGAD